METTKLIVWDDEDGNCYAEGHHEPGPFLEAVDAYVAECGLTDELAQNGIIYIAANVDHLWGRENPDDDEHWFLCDEGDQGAEPFTRVTA